MNKKKILAFFKYALGEIFLVVVGILIALEINTINQNWSDANEEQKILRNLKTDFDYNLRGITESLEETNNKLVSNSLLLNLTGPSIVNPKKLNIDSLLSIASGIPTFLSREGYLDELINSGRFEIVQSDILRNKLSLWKPSISYLIAGEEATYLAMKMTGEYINKHGSWLSIDHHNPLMKSLIPPPSFKTDNSDLLRNQQFQNHIENDFWSLNALKTKQEEVVKINQEILELIEKEIIE